MFDDVKQSTEGGNQESQKQVEDIFEPTTKSEENISTYGSTPEINQEKNVATEMNTSPASVDYQSSNSSKKRKILTILLIVVIAGIVGIVGYMGWQYFNTDNKTFVDEIFADLGDSENNEQENVDEQIDEESVNEIDQTDTDNDGLFDQQEEEYGTDINLPDSDFDGLLDREEIEFYKTDPLKADTDGDSYQDGAEIKSGYNPLGPGKLELVNPIESN